MHKRKPKAKVDLPVGKYAQLTQPRDELPPKPGKCKCLKCGCVFESIDTIRNRLCTGCNEDNEVMRTTRTCPSYVHFDGHVIPITHEGE